MHGPTPFRTALLCPWDSTGQSALLHWTVRWRLLEKLAENAALLRTAMPPPQYPDDASDRTRFSELRSRFAGNNTRSLVSVLDQCQDTLQYSSHTRYLGRCNGLLRYKQSYAEYSTAIRLAHTDTQSNTNGSAIQIASRRPDANIASALQTAARDRIPADQTQRVCDATSNG
eukprot:2246861-Rhodomonas_salina.1